MLFPYVIEQNDGALTVEEAPVQLPPYRPVQRLSLPRAAVVPHLALDLDTLRQLAFAAGAAHVALVRHPTTGTNLLIHFDATDGAPRDTEYWTASHD